MSHAIRSSFDCFKMDTKIHQPMWKPVGTPPGLSEPKPLGIEKIQIRTMKSFSAQRKNVKSQCQPSLLSLVQRDLAAPTRRAKDMSHQGEGNAVLVISQFSHNLSVSLNNTNTAGSSQVEHACSTPTSRMAPSCLCP